jgi:hypothetical protein
MYRPELRPRRITVSVRYSPDVGMPYAVVADSPVGECLLIGWQSTDVLEEIWTMYARAFGLLYPRLALALQWVIAEDW